MKKGTEGTEWSRGFKGYQIDHWHQSKDGDI